MAAKRRKKTKTGKERKGRINRKIKRKIDTKKIHSKKSPKDSSQNPYLPTKCKVLGFFRETPDTFTLRIEMKTKHEPGQFVQLSIPGIGECPISICSFSQDYIELSIREVGDMTKGLSRLRKGDYVLARGPYGKGYPMQELKGNSVIIIGGGCGVAPLKGVIDYVEKNRSDYKEVHLFLGYRSPNDILYAKELDEWKNKYNLTVTVDQNAKGEFCYNASTGFITDAIKNSSMGNENKVVFLCGPPMMIKNAIQILKDKGFHDDQLFISAERLMYCALGVCCHCMIRGKFTCIDGPVFRYDEIKDLKND